MKTEIENNNNADKKARAKRADIDAMQERFDAIAQIANMEAGSDVLKLALVVKIAEGASLDEIIREAGRQALGLTS